MLYVEILLQALVPSTIFCHMLLPSKMISAKAALLWRQNIQLQTNPEKSSRYFIKLIEPT
jgi:hypothetical protein